MLEQHTTRDGQMMLIAQMDNEHLLNLINFRLSRAEAAMHAVEESATICAIDRKLYALPEITGERAAQIVRREIGALYPYISECWLRGVDTYRERFQQLLGREGQLPTVGNKALTVDCI
jgi:hypothetical protein